MMSADETHVGFFCRSRFFLQSDANTIVSVQIAEAVSVLGSRRVKLIFFLAFSKLIALDAFLACVLFIYLKKNNRKLEWSYKCVNKKRFGIFF